MGIIHGKFATSPFLSDVLTGSIVSKEDSAELREAAMSESDSNKKKTLLEMADLKDFTIDDLENKYGTLGAAAIMRGNAEFFCELAELVIAYRRGSGGVSDSIRHRLEVIYEGFMASHDRAPTEVELKAEYEKKSPEIDRSQLAKLVKQLGLNLMPAKLLQGIRFRAESIRKAKGIVRSVELREALHQLKSAKMVSEFSEKRFATFCRSIGVELSIDPAVWDDLRQ